MSRLNRHNKKKANLVLNLKIILLIINIVIGLLNLLLLILKFIHK